VRLAFSEGETARLSGQMSIFSHIAEKRGFCKAGHKLESRRNRDVARIARRALGQNQLDFLFLD